MPEQSYNPFKLWEELKRRKVVRVIVMYAGAAYIIIELVNNVAEPLHLPDWTATLVILLLIIGFPIVAILSWIFDVTPEGLKKTEPAEIVTEDDQEKPVRRKLRVSDGIIAVLIVVILILLYPKVFKKDKFGNIREDDGRISVVVLPFENLSGDTLYDGFELGLQDFIITNLSNSDQLSVRHIQTMYDYMSNMEQVNYASITSSFASDVAQKLDANTVIFGSLSSSGNRIRIIANLMDSRNKEIYQSFPIEGEFRDNMFHLADSISILIKNFLEIKVIEQDSDDDTRFFVKTQSAEAYRYFSKGLDKFWINDWESAIDLFSLSLEIDPKLLWARIFLFTSYTNKGQFTIAKNLSDSLYRQIDEYDYVDQLYIKYFHSLYEKDASVTSEMIKKILIENPYSRGMWYEFGRYYANQLKNYNLACEALEKSLEIDQKWGTEWKWRALYLLLGRSYHETGQHEKEKEIYELGLHIIPNDPGLIAGQAICALSQGDSIVANKYIEHYVSLRSEQNGWLDIRIYSALGSIYSSAEIYDKAKEYYGRALDLDPDNPTILNNLAWLLIDKDIDIEEGLRLVNKAIKVYPDNGNFLRTKGVGLYKQGSYKEARELLEASWDISPVYYHDHYLLLQEIEQTLAKQRSEQ